MSNFKNDIDKLVSRILNEEIENKFKQLSEEMGEWTEIEMDEELHGNQKKLDVAEPKGKIDAADFKKLRSKKKETKETEEMDEWFFYDDEEDKSVPGDYEGDEEAEDEAEELSAQEPTYVGKGLGDNKWDVSRKPKMIGSFDDEHGWFDDIDAQSHPNVFSDYDEEEFSDFDTFMSKYGKNQSWFAPKGGDRFFKMYQDKFGGKPFRVRTPRDMGEQETEEGNAFTGALADAKKDGKDSFEVDGKKYQVKEAEEKWIQKTGMKKGALHKKLGVPEGDKIPVSKLKSLKKELMKKGEGDKKLSAADSKLLKQVNLAMTLKSVKESLKPSLKLTENELIDMIEQIVLEQKVKDKSEKENISKKSPEGLKKTEKVLGQNKKENDDYAKDVVKKMKDYMKDMVSGGKGYDENPDDFPQSNYDMEKEHNEKKYHPSDAVEEYIEAFAYPGMTNLVYDEIKPDEEMIEKQIKGDSKNGNAVTSKDGKALGNVSKRSEKTGERFKKNFDENLYGAEQMNVSYKRQPQPVDIAGEKRESGGLKKNSTQKAQKIMNQLESTEDKKNRVIAEEMEKMKNLIGYNRKTQ
jgi:hypothetical protein